MIEMIRDAAQLALIGMVIIGMAVGVFGFLFWLSRSSGDDT